MLAELALGRVGLGKGVPRPGGELSQSLACATSHGEKAGVPVLRVEAQSRIRQAPMGGRGRHRREGRRVTQWPPG